MAELLDHDPGGQIETAPGAYLGRLRVPHYSTGGIVMLPACTLDFVRAAGIAWQRSGRAA